jgi:Family of unknown function (DUF5985)
MAETIYALCAITSAVCVVLLWRAWSATHLRLLLWSLVCFAGLLLNNIMLIVDKVLVEDTDLSAWRTLPAAIGVGALVYGLIWDARTR